MPTRLDKRQARPPDDAADFDSDMDFDAVREQTEVLSRAVTDLDAENKRLKAQLEQQQKKRAAGRGPGLPNTAGALLLPVVLMIAVRWLVYDLAPGMDMIGVCVLNLAVGVGWCIAVEAWLQQEFARFGFLMMPNCIFVFLAIFFYVDNLLGGPLTRGEALTTPDIGRGSIAAMFFLFLAMTKFWVWIVTEVMRVLNGEAFR